MTQTVDCSGEWQLSKFAILKGAALNIMAIYSNNRIGVYVSSEKTWKLSAYSRQNMYKLPKQVIQMKQQIEGAVGDGKDEKRLLLYTQ